MEETRESRAPRASVQSLRRIRKCRIQFEFQLQRCHPSAPVRRIVARQFGFRPSADRSALGGRPTSASVRRPFPSAFLRGQSPPPPASASASASQQIRIGFSCPGPWRRLARLPRSSGVANRQLFIARHGQFAVFRLPQSAHASVRLQSVRQRRCPLVSGSAGQPIRRPAEIDWQRSRFVPQWLSIVALPLVDHPAIRISSGHSDSTGTNSISN